ncbi:MAG: B12-binding domain-containing radical SAM protein [Candidatus Lokiarchaeota archaeon]|nr:B12-binding domain-containing radical SAM protein [Candidatus Lokiarchaeota archaeon]
MVFPRFKYPTGDPPLGPASLLAYLREHATAVEFKLFDATFNPSFDAIASVFDEFKPDITGIYCSTLMFDDALKIACIGKKKDSYVVIGGPHATMAPETLISRRFVDAVVLGEGEKPLLHLLNAYPDKKKIASHPSIITRDARYRDVTDLASHACLDLIENLDDLPVPAYDLLEMNKYIDNWFQMDAISPDLRGTNVIVSRGCPYACSFCQPTLNKIFGEQVRYRSPSRVVEEIALLRRMYRINSFILTDDTPTFNPRWMREFVSELKKKRLNMVWGCNTRVGLLPDPLLNEMKLAGFKRVMVGIESGSQRILDDVYHKGITLHHVPAFISRMKSAGMKIFAYFMIGAPTETKREIKSTIDLAFALPIDEATFSITTPLPGTFLAEKIRSDGYSISSPFSRYDYYSTLIYDQGIGSFTMRSYQRVAFLKFYLHPRRWSFLLRMVSSRRGIKKAMLKLKRIIEI